MPGGWWGSELQPLRRALRDLTPAALATAWMVTAAGCGTHSDGHSPRYVNHEMLKALAPAEAREAAQAVAKYDDMLGQYGGKMNMALDFSRTRFGDEDLARLDFPDGVTAINLSDTRVTDAGLVHLGRARNLQRLDLSRTAVTTAGLQGLTALPKLWQVNLEGCPHVTRHDELNMVHTLASRSPAHVHERKAKEMLSQGP